MKHIELYFSKFVFGGFNNEFHDRLFFIYPSIRFAFKKYEKAKTIIFGFGLLFWEFVLSIDIQYDEKGK